MKLRFRELVPTASETALETVRLEMPQTVARTSDAAIVEQRNRDLLRNGQGDILDPGTIDQLRRLRGTLLRTLARAKTTRAAR